MEGPFATHVDSKFCAERGFTIPYITKHNSHKQYWVESVDKVPYDASIAYAKSNYA